MAPYYVDDGYVETSLLTGFVPPEAFVYLDKKGFIQDSRGIPIFYHIHRRANVKSVNNNLTEVSEFRFETSISNRDINQRLKIDRTKFWWIYN